jgi:hypothetical protein
MLRCTLIHIRFSLNPSPTEYTQPNNSSGTVVLERSSLALRRMVGLYSPEARDNAQRARCQRDVIRRLETNYAFVTVEFATSLHLGVRVVHGTVEQVEDVSAYNRGERHEPPIDCETFGTKHIDYDGWKHPKENPVGEPT